MTNMPTQAQLDKFSLIPGDPARARDTDCTICQLPTTNAVITTCLHIYCFECLHPWADQHATCPICRHDLTPRPKPSIGTLSASAPDPTHPPSTSGGERTPLEPAMRAYINACRHAARDHLLQHGLPVDASPEVARTCAAVVIDAARMTAKLQVAADESLARIVNRKPSQASSKHAQNFFSFNVAEWSKLLATLDRYVLLQRDVEAMLMKGVNAYVQRAGLRGVGVDGPTSARTVALVNLFKVLAHKVVNA